MPTYEFTTANDALPTLMQELLDRGTEVGSRNGRVKELLNTQITLTEPWKREILTPHRRASLPAQIAETMWLLAGRDDVKWLSHYLPRAPDFSDDGRVWRGAYGPRIREWSEHQPFNHETEPFDQLKYVIDLFRKDPLDRRAVIQIYDPLVDSQPGKDIPCNDFIHFLSRGGELHMFVTVRSNDAMWGWSGINTFEWSALQEIIAGMLGIEVGPLTFNVSSFHLYSRHWEKARKIAEGAVHQMVEPHVVEFAPFFSDVTDLDNLIQQWFGVETSIRKGDRGAAEFIEDFPEPMLQAWLRVIAWYWSGDEWWLEPLKGTRLYLAALESPPKKKKKKKKTTEEKALEALEHDRALEGAYVHGADQEGARFCGATTGLKTSFAGSVVTCPACKEHIDKIQVEGNWTPPEPAFVDYVAALHADKHAAYGDSWKRRGEMLGIMANIARKIDRLGQNTSDETSADTAIDLLVYLVKYRWWLTEFNHAPTPVENTAGWTKPTDYAEPVELLLKQISPEHPSMSTADIEHLLTWRFSRLETHVKTGTFKRHYMVDSMIRYAFTLAERLWETRSKPLEPVVEGDDYLGADHE